MIDWRVTACSGRSATAPPAPCAGWLHIYIYIYIHTYVCMSTYMCIYIYIHTNTLYIYIYTYLCMPPTTCAGRLPYSRGEKNPTTFKCYPLTTLRPTPCAGWSAVICYSNVCIYIYIHIYIYIYIYIYTHIFLF